MEDGTMMEAEEDFLTEEVNLCLKGKGLFIKEKLKSKNSTICPKFLVARGSKDGPLAVLKMQKHRSDETYGEQKHWSKINHRNCVKLLDKFLVDSKLAFLYEHCAVGKLDEYLHHIKAALPDECLQSMFRVWIKQLLQALSYLQQLNLYHQFLRPKDLLLDGNRNLKLSGFGALRTSRAQLQSFVIGKYLPPEIMGFKNDDIDYDKLHTWSAGAVLLEIFCSKYIGGANFNPDFAEMLSVHRLRTNIDTNVKELRNIHGLAEDICNVFVVMLISEVKNRPTVDAILEIIHSWEEELPENSDEELMVAANQQPLQNLENTCTSQCY